MSHFHENKYMSGDVAIRDASTEQGAGKCRNAKTGRLPLSLCRLALSVVFLVGLAETVAADVMAPLQWGDWSKWGDQGDGTFRNPVLPSDYSDLDCIRVGENYYAISSTFQFSPGVIILQSKDLVNWTILGHAVPDVTQISPEMNWDRMNRYGVGVWAGAIRYAKNRFWIYFGTPDEGYFMTSAPSPAGPWEPLHPVLKSKGWDDCCPFWDDDGQGYFVGTHYADNCKTYIWKLTPDGKRLVEESRTLINEGAHREANKLLKIKGWYYHMFSEVKGVRVVMMQRSRSVMGPYTERRQLTDQNRECHEPNQGGLVDTVNGDWYFLTHHGNGDWEGRPASLLPVTWIDGWPICGTTDTTGKPGLMFWGGRKPLPGKVAVPQSSDDFAKTTLSPQWEWNYQPRADKWSLTERPGFLRLRAFRPLASDDLMKAGNTLTQRCFRTKENLVVLKLDLTGLMDGQKAGLCHFAQTHSALGVVQEGNVRRIEYRENGHITVGPEIKGNQLWLKSTWGLDGLSRYAYSTDGKIFTDFGPPYQMSWGFYRGDRIGIYNFNNKQDAGYVDVDYLIYHYDSPAGGGHAPTRE
jgi:beta-xylosidase